MKLWTTFLLLMLFLHSIESKAIDKKVQMDFQTKFDKLNTKHGLSDNQVLDIIQDRYGFIWLATKDGLNRFDGYEFITFKNNPTDSTSISSNLITSITEDIYGNLWIGTTFGLNKYDRTKDSFTRYFSNLNNNNSLRNDHIRKLLADEKGVLWIETVDGHLHSFNIRTGIIKYFKHNEIHQEYYYYHSIYKENDSILWIGGRGLNVHQFNIKTEQFRIFLSNDNGGSHFNKRSNDVACYFKDSRNQFWICGLDGIYKYDQKQETCELFLTGSTYHIFEDKKGVLWFGTGNGIYKYDTETEELIHIKSNVNNPHSLSNNYVNKIIEDMSGVIWVATNEGLNLYSPKKHNFTHYFHIPGEKQTISGSKVKALAEDKEGLLWIGTDTKGISVLDFTKGLVKEYHHSEYSNSLLSDRISAFYFDSSDNLWIGQWSGKGLNKLHRKTGKFSSYVINTERTYHDWYHQMMEDKNGDILLAVWGGYGLYKIAKNSTDILPLGKDLIISPNENYVSTISPDSDSIVWYGGMNGQLEAMVVDNSGKMLHLKNIYGHSKPNYTELQKLQKYNYRNDIIPPFDTITHILQTNHQVYFANNVSLFAYDKSAKAFHQEFPKELLGKAILSICSFNDEVYFLSPDELSILNKEEGTWFHKSMDLFLNRSSEILVDKNYIYISRDKILFQFSHDWAILDSTKVFEKIIGLKAISSDGIIYAQESQLVLKKPDKNELRIDLDEKVKDFIVSGDTIYWLSDHMLWRTIINNGYIQETNAVFKETSPRIDLESIYFHHLIKSENIIYVSGNKGYLKINLLTNTISYNREKENSFMRLPVHLLTSICAGKGDDYWLGTTSTGIAKWNAKDNKIINYISNEFEESAFWGESVSFVFKDSKARIWSGSEGLNLYHEQTDSFQHFTTEQGLPSNHLKGIAEDNNGRLWITTSKGLSCFSVPEKSFINYTMADGLPESELSSAIIKLSDGRIAFGSHHGFAVFSPDSLLSNNYIPPVVITQIQIQDNQVFYDVSELDTIVVNPNENHISIRFSTLDYNSPEDNKYQYKLEGVDLEWIQTDSKNRGISYSNLKPGTYQFKLKGSNNNGIWNEYGKSITIVILPKYYQRWWFFLLIGAFVVFVITMIVIYRIRELKLQNKAASLEQRFLRSQMNPHFIFNSLTAIQSFIFKNEPIEAATYLSNFSDLVRMILNNSREDLISIQTEIKTLRQYLDLQVLRFGDRFEYKIDVDDTHDIDKFLIPPMLAQPFIENSIEHGFLGMKAQGLIHVCFRKAENHISLICEDNGMGINASLKKKLEENKRYKSLATRITRDRIVVINKVHKSNIQLEIKDLQDTEKGKTGTRVEIKIPLNLANKQEEL